MFKVIETKAGFAIQNVKTYVVIQVYPTKAQAEKEVNNLNKK
jgi:hypothetical protein